MKNVIKKYAVATIYACAAACVLLMVATFTENWFLAFVTSLMLLYLLFIGFCFYVIGYGIIFLSKKMLKKLDLWRSKNDLIIRKPIVIKPKKKESAFLTL